MGVPSFFRWISTRYPKILLGVSEDDSNKAGKMQLSPQCPVWPSDHDHLSGAGVLLPVECDNLYLDVNGILHPCCHPEDRPMPSSEDEMFKETFKYFDRLVDAANPKKLIYFAVDGVAPRAKMNQQRSRRYRTARDMKASIAAREEKLDEFLMDLDSEELAKKAADRIRSPYVINARSFDSNCISPGTEFMDNFSRALRGYIADRLSDNPRWKGLKVILSDSSVPGEGEHKIMNYIRTQRVADDYDPNLVHVIHGLDADLIMLVLATHEEHFYILREHVDFIFPENNQGCLLCGCKLHETIDCINGIESDTVESKHTYKPLVVIKISVLKEYLATDLMFSCSNVDWDICKAINDWIFICFFVGNDFLPHIPTLEIRENAITVVISIWKRMMQKWDGYLTDRGNANVERVLELMKELSYMEPLILSRRYKRDSNRGGRFSGIRRAQNESMNNIGYGNINSGNSYGEAISSDVYHQYDNASRPELSMQPRPLDSHWLEKYYMSKFRLSKVGDSFRANIAGEYIKGLCWVLRYYFQGCASWSWYFPAYYSPYAADFSLIESVEIEFDKSEPSKPYEQLLSILPPFSANILPQPLRYLLVDESSPIKYNFPDTFEIDTEGVKYEWQGVVLLPFVDITSIKSFASSLYANLTEQEAKRNEFSNDVIFVDKDSSRFQNLDTLLNGAIDAYVSCDRKFGVLGKMEYKKENEERISKDIHYYKGLGLHKVNMDNFNVLKFDGVVVPEDYVFESKVLDGVKPELSLLNSNFFDRVPRYRNRGAFGGRGSATTQRGRSLYNRNNNDSFHTNRKPSSYTSFQLNANSWSSVSTESQAANRSHYPPLSMGGGRAHPDPLYAPPRGHKLEQNYPEHAVSGHQYPSSYRYAPSSTHGTGSYYHSRYTNDDNYPETHPGTHFAGERRLNSPSPYSRRRPYFRDQEYRSHERLSDSNYGEPEDDGHWHVKRSSRPRKPRDSYSWDNPQ